MQCNLRKIQTQKVEDTICSVPTIIKYDQPTSSADQSHNQQVSQPSTSASQQCQTQGTPAYLAKKRKEITTSKKIPLISTVINIDDIAVETIDDVTPVVALHGINLLTSDIILLESQHGWLNQKLINVGQKMLQAKFPETEGLTDVGCSDTLTYSAKATTNFVQILNVDRCHWVCVSTKFCPPSTVNVFDSYQTGKSLTFSTKEAIAAMIKSHDKVIMLNFPVVQQQPNTSSCGLFALANAYTLCEGKDPVSINYDVNNMRSHFLSCIFNKEFNAFPSTKSKSLSRTSTHVETFTIHCICRLPDDGTGMICCDKCKDKYHTICIGLDVELKQKTWYCEN